jgi:hypothetical protein
MVDLCVAQAVSLVGVAAEHFANDIRLLAHDKVLDEPHESTQVRLMIIREMWMINLLLDRILGDEL